VRITDIALSTPVVGARPAAARRAGSDAKGPLVSSGPATMGHPDEVAAGALAKAASLAHAGRVVASSNEHAAASVKGDLLDLTRVP
jgi:hypothetical protein